jgi:hypothetical protein
MSLQISFHMFQSERYCITEGILPKGYYLDAVGGPSIPYNPEPVRWRMNEAKNNPRRREQIPLMPEAATSAATWSTEQWMFEMVHGRIAAGDTTVVSTTAVLRCGKQMEKLPR